MAKLRHVAIRCDDLHWGAKFYSECFEMEEVGRVGNLDVAGAVYLSDGVMNVALIKVVPDYPNFKPDGLNHFGFVVNDVAKAVEKAKELGCIDIVDPAAAGGAGVTWEVKMKTPDGVAFDFTEHGWPGVGALD
ncbi:MAG: VOC family protein [Acidimicrobiia bacterium]